MSKQKLIDDLKEYGLPDLARRAAKGEFSDFASQHDMPITVLVALLEKAGANDLATNARNGEYDHDK